MRKFLTDLGYTNVKDFINICNTFGDRLTEEQKKQAIIECIRHEPLTRKSIWRYLRRYDNPVKQGGFDINNVIGNQL